MVKVCEARIDESEDARKERVCGAHIHMVSHQI